MKRTEITYKRLSKGIIWVLDIKNVVPKDGLPYEYLSKSPYYYLKDHCFEGLVLHIVGQERETELEEGLRYNTLDFGYMINVMMQAGERLMQIRRAQAIKQLMTGPHLSLQQSAKICSMVKNKLIEKPSKVIHRKNKDGSITLII